MTCLEGEEEGEGEEEEYLKYVYDYTVIFINMSKEIRGEVETGFMPLT